MVVGITGGLATGKSLVMGILRDFGATTFSADEAARAVLQPAGPIVAEVVEAFGSEMIGASGTVDRARLGRLVFADAEARRRLNQIMHPPIIRLLRAQIDAAQLDLPTGTVVAVEVPLLFETHLETWFERIIVVSASEAVQIARLCARNGFDESEARRRLAAQWPMALKVARADIVLSNDQPVTALRDAVKALWQSFGETRQKVSAPEPRGEFDPSMAGVTSQTSG